MGRNAQRAPGTEPLPAQLLEVLPGRFRGLIHLNGHTHPCYLPLSSKLGVKIPQGGVPCWVLPKGNGKQAYSLFSFHLAGRWFLLDPKELQARTLEFLQNEAQADFVSEAVVTPGYRADFVSSPDEGTIVEVKTVLVPNDEPVSYPSTKTPRFERQLSSLLGLRRQGLQVRLLFLCLGGRCIRLHLAVNQPGLRSLLVEARDLGISFEILKVVGHDTAFHWEREEGTLLELVP